MRHRMSPCGLIGIPFGRSRPIDFKEPNFYVHHLDDNELHRFLELTNSSLTPPAFAFSAVTDQSERLPRAATEASITATHER